MAEEGMPNAPTSELSSLGSEPSSPARQPTVEDEEESLNREFELTRSDDNSEDGDQAASTARAQRVSARQRAYIPGDDSSDSPSSTNYSEKDDDETGSADEEERRDRAAAARGGAGAGDAESNDEDVDMGDQTRSVGDASANRMDEIDGADARETLQDDFQNIDELPDLMMEVETMDVFD